MGQNQLVNPPGVVNHPEMGAFVLLNINRADFLLVKGNALILEGQQHIGLVFKPIAVHLRQLVQIACGNGAQPCLGVGNRHAHEDFENSRGGAVAEPASGGHVRLGKVPAAQDNTAGFQHFLAAGAGILRMMLVVAVHGDNAQTVRPVLENIPEGVLQSCALALVGLVVQQGDFRVLGCKVVEVVQIFGLAAVVDQDNIGKTIFQQSVHHGDQLVVGIQGRQNHGNSG